MRYETVELAMRDSAPAIGMPRLDAFDEEFGREPVAVLRGHRRRPVRFSAVLGAALGAAVITALAWPWVQADGGLGFDVRALLPVARGTPHDNSAEQVAQLMREVDSLKSQIADLTDARQQALDRIESLEAAEQSTHEAHLAYWYSDPAALRYGLANSVGSSAVAPTPRRSATVRTEGRTEPRDGRRREGSAPLSLEAPQ
jgi:hypothetical protein